MHREGLEWLDAWMRSGDEATLVVVDVADEATCSAVARHVLRRATEHHRDALTVHAEPGAGALWGLAERLGLASLSWDPIEAGRQLFEASQRVLVILLGAVGAGSWEHEVLECAALLSGTAKLVMIGQNMLHPFGWSTRVRTLALDASEGRTLRAYWDGLYGEAREVQRFATLAELDEGWRSGRLQRVEPSEMVELSEAARTMLAVLQAPRRAWPREAMESVGDAATGQELVERHLVRAEGAHVRVQAASNAASMQTAEPGVVADALERHFRGDPWVQARAAAGWLEAGASDKAEAVFAAALGAVQAAAARRDLWEIWRLSIQRLGKRVDPQLVLRSADRARAAGDNDAGLALVQAVLRVLPSPTYDAWILQARLQLAGGDLVSARAVLERTMGLARSTRQRAYVIANQAEVCFWTGETSKAASLAGEAQRLAPGDVEIRLLARAVQGKLLLAQGAIEEAEGMFSVDEADAELAGLVEAGLRARLNRGVALLKKRRIGPAKAMLERVLQEGERLRNPHVTSRALFNLGVAAEWSKRPLEASELYQRGISICQQLSDVLAFHMANLCGLRLALGQTDLAEHTLVQARRMLRPGVTDSIIAELCWLAAMVSMERGATADALTQVRLALEAGARAPGCETLMGRIYRTLARTGLEDGDLARAALGLEQSEKLSVGPADRAEYALLQARLARARGRPDRELLLRAARLAEESNDEDLCIECCLLRAAQSRNEGDLSGAHDALQEARILRDHMTARLPDDMRRVLLGRRLFRSLERHERELELCERRPPPSRDAEGADPPPATANDLGGGFMGAHARVVRLFEALRRIARTPSPVLICGETGTGKELVAEAIHAFSERRKGPLVKVNCAALVEDLLLSELFGHERGAFTGAAGRRRGRFELADGGTIFLDEIGDISARTQVCLLRVLQDGTFDRVGGTVPVHSNARVVFATHRDLCTMVSLGLFREDLYFRLSTLRVDVPPLRERGHDLLLLADHFLHRIALERGEPRCHLSSSAISLLERHPWPGNVRELQNVLRAATILSDDAQIEPADLAPHLAAPKAPSANDASNAQAPISLREQAGEGSVHVVSAAYHHIRSGAGNLGELKRQIERACVERALRETGGNITRAAQLLGVKRPRLSQLVRDLGLRPGTPDE